MLHYPVTALKQKMLKAVKVTPYGEWFHEQSISIQKSISWNLFSTASDTCKPAQIYYRVLPGAYTKYTLLLNKTGHNTVTDIKITSPKYW